jgi:hypothetical protein
MKRAIFFLSVLFFVGCVDHVFDEPPGFMPEVVETNADIGDLLDVWVPESFRQIENDLIFKGRVVANDESGNFYKQLVLEDETGGIQVRLDAIGLYNEYPLGREVVIKAQGLWISDYNGLPQLSSASGSGADITSIAIPEPLIPEYVFNTASTEIVAAKVLEISDLKPDLVNTFVKFENVQFVLSSVSEPLADSERQFSVNHDIENCDEETVIVRTSGFASFADVFTPTGNGSIEGILSSFRGDYQILLVNENGINMQGARCEEDGGDDPGNTGELVEKVEEDFESQVDNQDISITEWSNIAVKGTRKWRAKEFDGNVYAQATAYNDTNDEMEAWLITPKIKFDSPMKLELRSAIAFHVHDGLSVWYSKDFDGTNVDSATWTELDLDLAGGNQDNYAWVDSGEVDLSMIEGNAYIGFKYEGNPSNGTTSFIVDDVKIVDK